MWLWMLTEPLRLGSLQHTLRDRQNKLYLSAASSWEISIKYGLGRLPLPLPPREYIPSRLQQSGVTPLPITHSDTYSISELPQHHRDPFDRILVAQAVNRGLTLVSADPQLELYDVRLLKPG